MAKEDLLEMIGVITEVLPDARYRVTLENGHELIGYANGKMKTPHPYPCRRQSSCRNVPI